LMEASTRPTGRGDAAADGGWICSWGVAVCSNRRRVVGMGRWISLPPPRERRGLAQPAKAYPSSESQMTSLCPCKVSWPAQRGRCTSPSVLEVGCSVSRWKACEINPGHSRRAPLARGTGLTRDGVVALCSAPRCSAQGRGPPFVVGRKWDHRCPWLPAEPPSCAHDRSS